MLRQVSPALTGGDFKVLLADDASEVIAYGRKVDYQAAVVLINRSNQTRSGAIPVAVLAVAIQGAFELLAVREETVPDSLGDMTWVLSEWGFEMTLSRDVPSTWAVSSTVSPPKYRSWTTSAILWSALASRSRASSRASRSTCLASIAPWRSTSVIGRTSPPRFDERRARAWSTRIRRIKRAQSAKKYLVNLGVADARLETLSFGEEKALLFGHDELSWDQNRRDDFVIIK